MYSLFGKHWHHLPTDEVLDLLDTNIEKGLDIFEVKHRQQRFGLNVLTPKKGQSPLVRFLLQFNNPPSDYFVGSQSGDCGFERPD